MGKKKSTFGKLGTPQPLEHLSTVGENKIKKGTPQPLEHLKDSKTHSGFPQPLEHAGKGAINKALSRKTRLIR